MKFTKLVKASVKQDIINEIPKLIEKLSTMQDQILNSNVESIHYEYILDHIQSMIAQLDIDSKSRLKL